MAKLLTVMALDEALPGSVHLHLARVGAGAWQSEDLLRFLLSGKGYEENANV
jgi:hypothetical protein